MTTVSERRSDAEIMAKFGPFHSFDGFHVDASDRVQDAFDQQDYDYYKRACMRFSFGFERAMERVTQQVLSLQTPILMADGFEILSNHMDAATRVAETAMLEEADWTSTGSTGIADTVEYAIVEFFEQKLWS